MRKRVKVAIIILGLFGIFILFDPGGLIGAQEQTLPRGGLNVEILEAAIPQTTRRAEVLVRITDERGNPLDRAGVATEGAVNLRFILARIKSGERLYTAYTVRSQTGPVLGRVDQAAIDSGGTFREAQLGTYLYTFGAVLPADFDRTVTHTVGIYANRDLRHFDGNDYVGQDTFDFVPNGNPVTVARDVVSDTSCNQCHNPLEAHGGGRRTVALCIMCHSPQTVDPDTGNTVDFNVMVHKIHMGANLPSVEAGRPYRIIGFGGGINDYSTVHFPQDIRNCQTCHSGATQATHYMSKPSRMACASCHDNVNFATGENHRGIVQTNDNSCQVCHQPTSMTEFDLSVAGAHVIPSKSLQLPGTKFEIVSVSNTKPGDKLTVVFNIKDRAGKPILPSEMSRLAAVFGGPTTDYSDWYSEDARMAAPASDGNFSFTFNMPIPMTATGTYTVALEGYRNRDIIGFNRQTLTIRDAGDNVARSFAVTGNLVSRRAVVDINKCNACHDSLSLHGSNRNNNVQYCALCHNPKQTDMARRPTDRLPAESVDLKLMIHRIHTGEELENEYTAFGFGNVAHDYNEVRLPADRRECAICHLPGTELIGSTKDRLPTTTPRSFVNPTPPISAACTGCHDSVATLAHIAVNGNMFGESCHTCHGEGREFSVSRAHARRRDAR